MSLDIFGKFCPDSTHSRLLQKLIEIGSRNHVVIALDDSVDDDDRISLSERGLEGPGTCFSVYASAAETEATSLWNEASRVARDQILSASPEIAITPETLDRLPWPAAYFDAMYMTRLGMVLRDLMSLQGYERAGLALVDGGIERTYHGSAQECIELMLKMVVLPWDCVPNTLYVWPKLAE